MTKIILFLALAFITLAPIQARIGQDIRELEKILSVEASVSISENGPFLQKLQWTGKPGNTNLPLGQSLGMNLWQIQATAYIDQNKNLRTIIEMSYRKMVGGAISETEQNQIIFHNSAPQQLLNISEPKIAPPHRPDHIVIQYNQINELLRLKNNQMVKFESNLRCIGSNINNLTERFGKPTKVKNNIHYFTYLDDTKNVSWKIRVQLWQGPNNTESVAHRVVYERITKFTPEEQSWLMLINSNRSKWRQLKQDVNQVNQFTTQANAAHPLRAWVKPLLQEVGIETVEFAEDNF